jgi:Flp pilus assembly protein TadG
MRAFHRFQSDRNGNVALIFSFALVPMVMVAGMAIETSQSHLKKNDLQKALDASVLAAVSLSAREKKLGADPVKIAYDKFHAVYTDPVVKVSFDWRDNVASGAATISQNVIFGSFLGTKTYEVSANAAATYSPHRLPVCFMAMHPTRKHTLELKDSVSVYGPECNIYGNSDHPDDVVDPHTPQNFLTGKTIQAVGYGHHYLQNVKPPLAYAPELIPDPFGKMPIPLSGSCVATGKVVNTSGATLTPGTYCGGLTINQAQNVTLAPGVYFIRGGTLDIKHSTVSGTDVTFIFIGAPSPINWANSTITIAAPKTGSLAGMAFIHDRSPSQGVFFHSNIDIHGVFYMPSTEFTWFNKGNYAPKAMWTTFIIDGVTWRGSGTINLNFDIARSDIPYPHALKSVIPDVGRATTRLIQ